MGKVFHARLCDGEFFRDAPLSTSVSGARGQGPAARTKIATYYGSSFVSERGEDGDLHIYHVSATGLPTETFGDAAPRGPMTALRMQEIVERSRRVGGR